MKYFIVYRMYTAVATLNIMCYYWHLLTFRYLLQWGPSWGRVGEHARRTVARLQITSGLFVSVWKSRLDSVSCLPWPSSWHHFSSSWWGAFPLHEWVYLGLGFFFFIYWRENCKYKINIINISIKIWKTLDKWKKKLNSGEVLVVQHCISTGLAHPMAAWSLDFT